MKNIIKTRRAVQRYIKKYFTVKKLVRKDGVFFHYKEKNPIRPYRSVYSGDRASGLYTPMEYRYSIGTGNLRYWLQPGWSQCYLRGDSDGFLKKNPTKTPIPNDQELAESIIANHYLGYIRAESYRKHYASGNLIAPKLYAELLVFTITECKRVGKLELVEKLKKKINILPS